MTERKPLRRTAWSLLLGGPLGPNSPPASSITCTAGTPGTEPRRLPVSESITSAEPATITCDAQSSW